MSADRQNINVELINGAKEKLEETREFNGMTQKEMVSRLINWFCGQDRLIQQIVLGQIPADLAPELAPLIVRRWEADATSERPALIGEMPDEADEAAEADALASRDRKLAASRPYGEAGAGRSSR